MFAPFLFLPGVVLPQAPAAEGRGASAALLIGINEFQSPGIIDLRGALNDIEAMRKLLTTRYGFAEKAIRVLHNEEAKRKDILSALDDLVKGAGDEDVIYLHFSGHGSQVKDLNGDEGQDDGMDETILPHDARMEGIADITDDELAAYLSRLKTKSVVVTLDSCHSGTGTRGGSAVTARLVAPDQRVSLYETPANQVSARSLVPIEEEHVLMTGAAAHQAALDGPVDGTVYGFFSYSLAKSLAAASPKATPEEVFRGIRSELRRIQEQLGRSSMPTPQLELRDGRSQAPLFPPVRAESRARGIARRPFVLVTPLSADSVLLADGALLWGVPGSLWGIYRPDETRFRPARAIATGVVTETRGRDSVLRIASRIKPITSVPPGSRAVVIASPVGEKIPLRLGRIPPDTRSKLEQLLGGRLEGIAQMVGEEKFARFILDRIPEAASRWQVSDSTGLTAVQVFEEAAIEALAGKLEKFLVRSRNATDLLSLDNAVSSLELDVEVHGAGRLPEAAERGGLRRTPFGKDRRAVRVVADTAAPRYRVRREGERRTAENSLQLEVRVNRDSYLTIVDVDAEGGVNILFPNAAQAEDFYPQGLVAGGETVLIPDSLESGNRARFFLDYGPPSGLDTIRVFASADAGTTEMIRSFVAQAQGEVMARSLPKSLRAMQLALARPRGVVVAADEPAGEPPDPGAAAIEVVEPFEPSEFEVSADFGSEASGTESADLVQGDWTAKSLTVLVEEY